MAESLSIDDLSGRLATPAAEIRRWQALGLLAPGDELSTEQVQRARYVLVLHRQGIDLEAFARVDRETSRLESAVAEAYPGGVGPAYSLEEAAALARLDLDDARRYWQVIDVNGQGDLLDEMDISLLRGLGDIVRNGFPESALLQIMRVYADSLTRTAEVGQRAFHSYVHEPLRRAGVGEKEAWVAMAPLMQQASRDAEPTLLYFFRKANLHAMRYDFVVHVAQELGLREIPDVPGQVERAVVFVDLASFTPLAEAMGDEKAAEVLDRFAAIIREAAPRRDGHVVKQIGDEFMLAFSSAAAAVRTVLEIEQRVSAERQFPAARAGIHYGPVLYREGDYVGATVNVASRVVAAAERHRTIVTAAARREAGDLDDVEFLRAGKSALRGVVEEVDLYEARLLAGVAVHKAIDPVCGMELGEGEIAATLTLEGRERHFCSDRCLRRFVAAPGSYA
jgi:class 3 adenylate cyclase